MHISCEAVVRNIPIVQDFFQIFSIAVGKKLGIRERNWIEAKFFGFLQKWWN